MTKILQNLLKLTGVLILLVSTFMIHSEINPDAIEIVRDSYGVPHIYGSK